MDITISDGRGRRLDVRVELSGSDLIVHSRSGQDRNPDYRPAVEALLVTLDAARIGYEVYLDSQPVQMLPLDRRRLSVPVVGPVADRFNNLVRAMNADSASNGAYRRIRFVTSAHQADIVRALTPVARGNVARSSAARAIEVERIPAFELRKVTSGHIDNAVSKLLRGGDAPNFADSRDYDVLAPGNVRLPPKKVFGLALEEALGIEAFPGHFTAGRGNPCFLLIEAAGYPIIARTDAAPLEQEPVDPDLAAAEGHSKVIQHLKRERKPALAAAKRRAMIAQLGFLRCEICEIIPSQKLGMHGDAVIEVHHANVQVRRMAPGHVTRLADLQCLCANCHRIVHREMIAGKL